MSKNEAYSHKDFTGKLLVSILAEDLAGQIVGSCFSQERPGTQVFPVSLPGTEFVGCNLDNVSIPAGCLVTDCSTRRFAVQPDGTDWEVDADGVPIRPLGQGE